MSARVAIDTGRQLPCCNCVRDAPVPGAREAYARRAVEVLLPPFLHGPIISDVGGSYRHPQFRCFPCIHRTGNTEHVHAFDLTSILRPSSFNVICEGDLGIGATQAVGKFECT